MHEWINCSGSRPKQTPTIGRKVLCGVSACGARLRFFLQKYSNFTINGRILVCRGRAVIQLYLLGLVEAEWLGRWAIRARADRRGFETGGLPIPLFNNRVYLSLIIA